ncbi:arginine deiminase family protein [Rossellomorea sp. KS-H15a]|uniref:arginine deiminase family protein n=1 Tax=Rossellomorea sp. KS-H15a TaxID=2963940 RepID=UPI0020C6CA43|nr:arginine deiminase family protein [Rossellomorea sp. KS-H15a]UTE77177.1 arginine deiminase family protein [Rossellomorea sp. KS-H15a]
MVKINANCWNEHGELKTVLVCSPSVLDVPDQRTADYVGWEKPVNQKKAKENHEEMIRAMENAGVTVIDYSKHLKDEDRQLNDQLINRVFVRDLACVYGNTVIPGDAGITMRAPEYVHSHELFQRWFDENTFSIQDNNRLKALENGDVFVLNRDTVFINTGLRSSIESVEMMKGKIFQAGFTEIGIIDLPRTGETMHLDMNCNVAGPDLLIAKSYMRLFPVQVVNEESGKYVMMEDFIKRHGFDVLWTDDVKHTVADINFLNLDPETLLVSTKANKKIWKDHPKLKAKKLIEVDVNELEKGGGGIRCMTLPFERSE